MQNDNDQIYYEVNAFNSEFASRLTKNVELSFNGNRQRGFLLYFKSAISNRIICVMIQGNKQTILDSIALLRNYASNSFSLFKPLMTDNSDSYLNNILK